MIDAKPLYSRFNKAEEFIVYGTRYSVLFSPEKYDAIYNRIRYLLSQKSGITSHNYAKIKIDLHDSLPLEKKH